MIWEEIQLGDVATTLKGFAFKSAWFNNSKSGIPVVKVKDFTSDSISIDEVEYMPTNIANDYLKYQLKLGDVIIQTVGSWASNPNSVVGKVVKVPALLENGLLNQNAVKLIFNEKVDSTFLFYNLKTNDFKAYIINTAQGAASQASISLESIKSYKFNLPPLETQKRIANILAKFDDLIENNLKRIKLLEEIAQNIYKEWFVNFHFINYQHTDFDEESGLPKGWEMKKLSELINLTMGQSPKSEFYNEHKEGLPFHQGVTGYGHRFVSHSIYCSVITRIAEEGDILFSVRAPVGRINIAPERLIIGRGLSAIRNKRNCQSFQMYQLKNHFFQEDLIGGGAIFNSVTKSDLENQLMISPSSNIVDDFERIVKPIDDQIWKLNLQNQNLKEAREILLPKLMNRTIEV